MPDGFILPVLYGLKAIMKVKGGKVLWATNPTKFLERHLEALAYAFKMPMEMTGFDPQKVAKTENSYLFMVGEVEKAKLKMEAAT